MSLKNIIEVTKTHINGQLQCFRFPSENRLQFGNYFQDLHNLPFNDGRFMNSHLCVHPKVIPIHEVLSSIKESFVWHQLVHGLILQRKLRLFPLETDFLFVYLRDSVQSDIQPEKDL